MPPVIDKIIQAARNLFIGHERSKKIPENEKLSETVNITECPIRFKRLTPPVKVCKNEDAAVCEKCAKSLDRCPACNEEFCPQENKYVDNILETMPVACKNNENGCCQIMIKDKILEHEEVCDYRLIKCNVTGCGSTDVIYYKMYQHMSSNHSKKNCKSFSFGTPTTIIFQDWSASIMYVNLREKDSGKLFTLENYSNNGILYIFVQHVGKRESARKYLYEVSFDQGQSLKFSTGNYCTPVITTFKEIMEHPNVLSFDESKIFLGNKPVSRFNVKIKIIKNEFFKKNE